MSIIRLLRFATSLLAMTILSACTAKSDNVRPYERGTDLVFNQCKPHYVGNANRLPLAWENAEYHKAVVTERSSGDCFFVWGAQTRSYAVALALHACVSKVRRFADCAVVAVDLNEYLLSDYYKFSRSCDALRSSQEYAARRGHKAIAMTSDSDHEFLYCYPSDSQIAFDNPFAAIMNALDACEAQQGYACNVVAVNEEKIVAEEFGLLNYERISDSQFSEYYETQSGVRLDYLDRSVSLDIAARRDELIRR